MAHALVEAVDSLESVLDACADAVLYSLTEDEVLGLLPRVEKVFARLDGLLRVPLVAEVEGRRIAKKYGAASTVQYLQGVLRMRKSVASKLVKLATVVGNGGLAATGKALAAGDITTDQAGIIDQSLRKLPSDVDTLEKASAEQTLLGNARQFGPKELEILGDHVYKVIAPGKAEARDEKRLEREQRRAEQSRWASFHGTGIPGTEELRFRAGTETMAKLKAMIEPLTKPRKTPETGVSDSRPYQRRAGDALAELVDAMFGTELPDNPEGRKRPELIIRVDLDHATGQLKTGMLPDGQQLSPETMAKLACEADLVPVWMADGIRPVAVAATSRYFHGTQRAAMIARDGGCVFPGCDRPPSWCHAHHCHAYRKTKKTTTNDGVLLCAHHHTVIHHGEWAVHIAPDGLPEFTPPPWIDPQQKPIRHTRHRRHPQHQR